jgi:hypothetical protein
MVALHLCGWDENVAPGLGSVRLCEMFLEEQFA